MLQNYINQITKFNDIYGVTKKFSNKQKGDLFEEFVKYIFLYHPYYINLTKEIWLYNECPDRIKKLLNLPDTDQGIDLIMLSKAGKYYAIQAKFRSDKNNKIKWDELGTFVGLTFGISNGFEKGFFVTNTTQITKNILNSDKIIPIFGDFFDNLSDNIIKSIKGHVLKNLKVQLDVFTARKYQKKIMCETILHFKSNDRGYINLACGTG